MSTDDVIDRDAVSGIRGRVDSCEPVAAATGADAVEAESKPAALHCLLERVFESEGLGIRVAFGGHQG